MKPIEVKKKLEDRYNKQNDFNRKNYDRVSVMFPKGYREDAYILEAVENKMNKIE